jgi:hypothetical protein
MSPAERSPGLVIDVSDDGIQRMTSLRHPVVAPPVVRARAWPFGCLVDCGCAAGGWR